MPFSSEFKHRSDHTPYDELQQCPSTGQALCKTSFREHQVRHFLELNNTANEIEVREVVLSSKPYFALQAKLNGDDIGTPLIGELPCPDQCIPPDFLGKSFDRMHVENVINTSQCLWMQVHRSKVSTGTTYSKFTIYALTDDGHGGLINEWNNGDAMYTTIN